MDYTVQNQIFGNKNVKTLAGEIPASVECSSFALFADRLIDVLCRSFEQAAQRWIDIAVRAACYLCASSQLSRAPHQNKFYVVIVYLLT
jgi:hypothetical protein